jgi:NAD(P)-dependent dehydrogenase (short-subunit alcohol dehydrogenase family)
MTGRLDGRVAIVTGAGRGLGRAHALHLAAAGASVVVNDFGAALDGTGSDATPAQSVVAEIEAMGGSACVSGHDVGGWDDAGAMVQLAIDRFGGLDILVNNAGILRDRTIANMSEAEWDAVIRVHLKGHAGPAHHAAAYWRGESKAGRQRAASIVHTTSVSGFSGSFGQANYAAAKLGVVALSHTLALEGKSYGMRSNAVSPSARTRITLEGMDPAAVAPPETAGALDVYDPANVSPLVGWLAEAGCPATAQVFHVIGDRLFVMQMPAVAAQLKNDRKAWTAEALDAALAGKLHQPLPATYFLEDFDA